MAKLKFVDCYRYCTDLLSPIIIGSGTVIVSG